MFKLKNKCCEIINKYVLINLCHFCLGNSGLSMPYYGVEKVTRGNQVTYILVIHQLSEEDAGNYTCTVRVLGMSYTRWPRLQRSLVVLSRLNY